MIRLSPTIVLICLLAILSSMPVSAQSDSAFFDSGSGQIGQQAEAQTVQLLLLDQPRLRLPAVSTLELAGAPEQRLGTMTASAQVQGRGLSVQGQLNIPQLTPFIYRDIPMLWELRIPPGRSFGRSSEPVTVSWQSAMANARLAPGAQVRVTPWVQQRRVERDGWQVIAGGVRLQIPVELLEAAASDGSLRGRLLIDYLNF